jgi:hypothetical protein
VLNEEKQGERRSLSELMGKSAVLGRGAGRAGEELRGHGE